MTELARRLGLGKSTVHRLLATLTAERILEHDPATGTYRLGLMSGSSGPASVDRVLHDAATTVIEELRNATKETVQVAVLDGRRWSTSSAWRAAHAADLRPGRSSNSAHCTSTGKVLLATCPRASGRAVAGWRPERKTNATVCDPHSSGPSWTGSGPRVGREHRRERARRGQRRRPVRNARGEVIAAVSVPGR